MTHARPRRQIIYAVFNAMIVPMAYLFLPEVANLSLEGVDQLFAGGKVKIRRKTKLSPRDRVSAPVLAGDKDTKEDEQASSIKSVDIV